MTKFAQIGLSTDEKPGARELRTYVETKGLYDVKYFDSYGHRGGNILAITDWIRSSAYTGSVVVCATTFDGFLTKRQQVVKSASEMFKIVEHLVEQTLYLGCTLVGENYWSNNNSDRKTGNVSGVLSASTDPRTAMASKLWVLGPQAVERIKALSKEQYVALHAMLYGRHTLEDLSFAAFLQVLTQRHVVYRDNNYVCLPISDSWKDDEQRAFDLRKAIDGCPNELRTAFKDRMWTYLRSDKELCRVIGKGHNGRFN